MRYVITAHPCPQAQRAALTARFGQLGAGYWRISPSTWLVVDEEQRGLDFWIETTHTAAPNARILVLHAGTDWVAWGEPGDFAWMSDAWD